MTCVAFSRKTTCGACTDVSRFMPRENPDDGMQAGSGQPLAAQFELSPDDLNLDLGPLGRLH